MNGIQDCQKLESAQNANQLTGIEKNNEIPFGYCYCGCGYKTKISPKSCARRNWIRGIPRKYLSGHHSRVKNPNSKGCMILHGGYIQVRTRNGDYYPYHRIIAENALGKELPPTAVVHHSNGNGIDNNSNLIICENNVYHLYLHQRQRAYSSSGHPDWRKCKFCKQYDDPNNLYIKSGVYHKSCMAKYAIKRRMIDGIQRTDRIGSNHIGNLH